MIHVRAHVWIYCLTHIFNIGLGMAALLYNVCDEGVRNKTLNISAGTTKLHEHLKIDLQRIMQEVSCDS